MDCSDELKKIFNELKEEAYDVSYHNYSYKETNQIVRSNIELILEDKKNLIDAIQHIFNLTNADNPSHFFIRQKCESILKAQQMLIIYIK